MTRPETKPADNERGTPGRMTRPEVAAVLGLTVRQVRSAEVNALRRLREAFQGAGAGLADEAVLLEVLAFMLTDDP
jgi:hypothetical protein